MSNKSTYPHAPNDPKLRTCRKCHSRMMPPAMCPIHPNTCLTCESKAGGICEQHKQRCDRCRVGDIYHQRYFGERIISLCEACDASLEAYVDDFMERHEVTAAPVTDNPAASLYDYGEGE